MAAGARCSSHLDEENRKKEQQAVELKRKALTDELDDLKEKRARMEADICALERSADEYSRKAKARRKLTFMTTSSRKEGAAAGD